MTDLPPNTVIPAFPYEGALYWLFAKEKGSSYRGTHPYYVSLYGPEHEKLVSRVTALVSLFDRIVIAAADARLPDYASHVQGDVYSHPDLRISMTWELNEWDAENVRIARKLLRINAIKALLASNRFLARDKETREHFLCRTLLQLRLAERSNGVLVGDSFFKSICDAIMSSIGDTIRSEQSPTHRLVWPMEIYTLDIVGLSFNADSVESFAAIRQSHEIAEYAAEFRSAIASAMATDDVTGALLQLMRKAMDQEEVRHHATSAFKSVGSLANLGGLVPVIGTIASGVGISADIGGRAFEKAGTRKQWYLLGAKMREVSIRNALSRLQHG